jgi:hypothetical protein
MSKLVAFVLIASSVGLSAATSQAMPLGSNRTQDSLVIPVAGRCGIAWHRGPYSGGRGRDGDFSPPPAQIPAGAANAPGSHLGW